MEAIAGFFAVIAVVAIVIGVQCLLAWLTMITLAAFGITAPFWGLVGAWILVGIVIGALRGGNKD